MFYDSYDGDPPLQRRELVSRACRHVICVSDVFCFFFFGIIFKCVFASPAVFKRSAASPFNLRQTNRKRGGPTLEINSIDV